MAKIKKNGRKGRVKKDSPWWQWLLVAVVALGLYYALNAYLNYRETNRVSSQESPSGDPKTSSNSPQTNNQETEWTLAQAEAFLPKEADPDHFEVHPLLPTKDALLSFGIPLKGEEPDPKGLTNTTPGLSLIHWNGNEYQSQPISLLKLEPALNQELLSKLRGPPQVGTPLEKNEFFLVPVRLFFNKDEQEAIAYLWLKEGQVKWAPLVQADGKEIPAGFWIGTTEKVSHKIRHRKRDVPYLIMETGSLDEAKPYEGFQWKVQTYRWEEGSFRYDEAYSKELTKKKQDKPE